MPGSASWSAVPRARSWAPGLAQGIGAGIGFTAGFFLEEIIEKILGGKIGYLDIELWPVFPTSFARMIGLLEDLADGRGTVRKHFISVLGGDVHFSYAMMGESNRTLRAGSSGTWRCRRPATCWTRAATTCRR